MSLERVELIFCRAAAGLQGFGKKKQNASWKQRQKMFKQVHHTLKSVCDGRVGERESMGVIKHWICSAVD